MIWVLVIGLSWLVVAAVAAVVIGRAIRLADKRQKAQRRAAGNFVVGQSLAPVVELHPAPGPDERPAPAAPDPAPAAPPAEGVVWTGHPSLPSMPVVPGPVVPGPVAPRPVAPRPAVPPPPKPADRVTPGERNSSAVL